MRKLAQHLGWSLGTRAIATKRALALVGMLALMVTAIPSAEAQIYSFQNIPDGASPVGGLFRDAAGNLYGTTSAGGADLKLGTVFKVDTTGVETVLHRFDGTDGAYPMAGVIRDAAGNLYGTTMQGGESNACDLGCGTIFKIDPTGNATVLHSFHSSDGRYPTSDLIPDAAGNLYGTVWGGALDKGIVFKVNRSGKLTVLYSFTGRSDGWQPRGRLARDAAGNLYGTTFAGGAYNWGTVFKLDTTGKETVLYSFNGAGPSAGGLFRDAAGNLYGTTWNGGAYNQGTVFKVDTSGTETVLYTFTGGADGREPVGPSRVIKRFLAASILLQVSPRSDELLLHVA